jgi:hypothetical protein
MTKRNSENLVELYPAMFTWGERGYAHNVFESTYNKILAFVHKHLKFTRKIAYLKQSNPYEYRFDVGDGWYGLLYQLILNVKYNDEAKGKWVTKVTQCKEKFGGLRFYVTGTSDKNWDLIREAEKKSYKICEETGSEIEVGVWNDGWVRTMCRKQALSKFAKMSDANELNGRTFDELWKPKEEFITNKKPNPKQMDMVESDKPFIKTKKKTKK